MLCVRIPSEEVKERNKCLGDGSENKISQKIMLLRVFCTSVYL